jgi:hypothetical protein
MATIEYTSGPLAGVQIPGGFHVTVATTSKASFYRRFLDAKLASGETVIAAVSRNQYRVVGGVRVHAIGSEDHPEVQFAAARR